MAARVPLDSYSRANLKRHRRCTQDRLRVDYGPGRNDREESKSIWKGGLLLVGDATVDAVVEYAAVVAQTSQVDCA